MLDLFGVPWSDVDLVHVRAFLEDAGEEGVTWEAKADDDEKRRPPEGEEPGRLRATTIRKAACGLANQIGGYLILGARWDKTERRWRLPGVIVDDPEAELWIGKLLRVLTPAPRFEAKTWTLDGGRVVAVVQVEPVDEPPCMTPQGHVYERVSGETLRVRDPALLDRLFRRGQHSRDRAEQFADRAARRALDVPRWHERSVAITLALAPVGRQTDDIASRLFVPSFKAAMLEALRRFVDGDRPSGTERWPQQDAYTVLAHFDGSILVRGGAVDREDLRRSTWLLQATWDGSVAAAAAFSSAACRDLSGFDQVILPGWREIAALAARLGGYGPARLSLGVYAAPHQAEDQRYVPGVPQGPPPGTLYAQLPEETWMRRWVSVAEPTTDTLGSLQRELQRAAGIESYEPEADEPA